MFKRTKENFSCEKCGMEVFGNGYTNHCPDCLWSKHVDITPGDRVEGCCGMMEPVRVERKNREYVIVHKCQKCKMERINKVAKEDNFEKLLLI